MDNFKAGYLVGILWAIGMFIIGGFNSSITDGQYASGIVILLMGCWLAGGLGILVGVKDANRDKDE